MLQSLSSLCHPDGIDVQQTDKKKQSLGVYTSGLRRVGFIQRISGSANCPDRINIATTIESFTQAANVNVDGSKLDVHILAPNLVQELLA